MRFGLRTLLGFIALLAISLALVMWRPCLGAWLGMLLFATAAAAYGQATKRRRLNLWGICALVVAGLILLVDGIFVMQWEGGYVWKYRVAVVDARSGAPIASATVKLAHLIERRYWREAQQHSTDASGVAAFAEERPTGGTESLFGIAAPGPSRYTTLGGRGLVVEADGYERQFTTLRDALGRDYVPKRDMQLPTITVRLERSQGAAEAPGAIPSE